MHVQECGHGLKEIEKGERKEEYEGEENTYKIMSGLTIRGDRKIGGRQRWHVKKEQKYGTILNLKEGTNIIFISKYDHLFVDVQGVTQGLLFESFLRQSDTIVFNFMEMAEFTISLHFSLTIRGRRRR